SPAPDRPEATAAARRSGPTRRTASESAAPGVGRGISAWLNPCPGRCRAPDAAQHAVLHGVVRRRAGAVTHAGVWYGPGSAKQRSAKGYALHRARDTRAAREPHF